MHACRGVGEEEAVADHGDGGEYDGVEAALAVRVREAGDEEVGYRADCVARDGEGLHFGVRPCTNALNDGREESRVAKVVSSESDPAWRENKPVKHRIFTKQRDRERPALPVQETCFNIRPMELAGTRSGGRIARQTLDAVDLLVGGEVERRIWVVGEIKEGNDTQDNRRDSSAKVRQLSISPGTPS